MTLFRNGLAALLGVMLMASPSAGQEITDIEGNWASGPKDLKYTFSLCGESGDQICAVLTYALDPNPKVQRGVGTTVINGAKRTGPLSWKASIDFSGHRMSGTMTLVSRDQIRFDGCAYLIVCGEYNLYRDNG